MTRVATVSPDTPFHARFIAGLGYPVRGAGLATCTALALAHYALILPALIGVIASLALWTATWRYAAACMLHTANGYADPPDIGADEHPAAGRGLTGVHLFAVALCILSGVLYPPAVLPLMVLFAITLPAIDMSLAFDGSIELALSPVTWWEVMRRFGLAYLIPVALNLATGVLILGASAATSLLPRLLSLPLFAFAYTYLIILNLHLMGAMIHQRHERFGLTPEAEALAAENGQDEDAQLLHEAQAMASNDRRGALGMLAARLQHRSAPPSLHQAYRELLRQEGLRDDLLVHGQIWIAASMANGETRRALGIVQECMELDNHFMPDDPATAGPLAELAARSSMNRLALRLCRGFLAQWPRSPQAPHYGLLAARLLAAMPDRRAEAAVLIGKLLVAWPDHPLRGEFDALSQQLHEHTKPA